MLELNPILFSDLLEWLFSAVWVFALFFILKRYVLKWIVNDYFHDKGVFYLPLIENIFWIILVVDILYEIAIINPIVALGVVGVVIALIWNYVKNFVQGTIFRFQKGNVIGQHFRIGDIEGKVLKLGNYRIDLELNSGEIMQMPYSRVISELVTSRTFSQYIKTVSITCSASKQEDLEAYRKKIISAIANLPWVVVHAGIKVEIVDDYNSEVKVKVFTSHEKYIVELKREIRRICSEN